MKNTIKTGSSAKASTLRLITGYSIVFCFILMLLSAFVVIPQINKLFETQYRQTSQAELDQKVTLLLNFVETQRQFMDDLAKNLSLTSAVTFPLTSNHSAYNLLNNTLISGSKGRLLLQDAKANTLLNTVSDLQGSYTKQEQWLASILAGEQTFHFQLLSQNNDDLTFKISVPVIDGTKVTGLLSAEISVPIMDIFVLQTRHKNVAIKLTQNSLTIGTKTSHILLATENKTELEELKILINYITDKAPVLERVQTIKFWTYSALLGSLVIFFLLFLSLVYTGLLDKEKLPISTKKKAWHSYIVPALACLLGAGISLAAFFMVLNIEESALENELVFESKKEIHGIRNQLSNYLHILDSMKAFYEGSNAISRDEFNTFVSPSLNTYHYIQALAWVPSVTHLQRADHTQQAKLDGLELYTIRERNLQGELVTAQVRDNYLPIHYVEPLTANEEALGFDLRSNASRSLPLFTADSSQDKVATAKISFVQQGDAKSSIFIFNPVYKNAAEPSTGDTSAKLQGFVLLVLQIEDLLLQILDSDRGHLLLFVQDITDKDNLEVIYGQQPVSSAFSREETLSLADRSWRVVSYQPLSEKALFLNAWLVLIFGFSLSAFIAFALANLIRRREIVEKLVAKRTLELRESEEQFRAIVENAVDGLLTIDALGTIEKFNKSAENIFGYTSQQAMGKDIHELMPDFDTKAPALPLEKINGITVKKSIGVGRIIQGKTKDGRTFPLDLSVCELNFSGTKKYSAIVRDITKRIILEEEREKFIEQLTDSNEELERFAYVCSHDLQEPLRMIRSFSEKLEVHIGESLKDDEKGKRYFHFITDGAARAQALIADILTYSSVGNATQQLENVNVEAIINTVRDNILLSSDSQNGSITFAPLPELRGNKTQILQLFQNLVNNGIKYQQPGTMPHVHISCEDSEKYWTFMIKDNGIGMEERHHKKIFDVFQRLHKRSLYAGTGIGLSICKKIVERHQGNIWVESTKGEGSTFYFTFLKFTGENNE